MGWSILSVWIQLNKFNKDVPCTPFSLNMWVASHEVKFLHFFLKKDAPFTGTKFCVRKSKPMSSVTITEMFFFDSRTIRKIFTDLNVKVLFVLVRISN